MTTLQPNARSVPEAPPPELRFRRKIGLGQAVRDLWRRRDLIRTMAERQVRAQYKQAALGIGWSVATPLLLMLVFTLFFREVARVDTGGIPYPIFTFVALIPWQFFATAVQTGANSLVWNKMLLNKVACPPEIYPLSSVAIAGINFVLSIVVLAVLMLIHGVAPAATTPLVIIPLVIELAFTVGVVLVLSAVAVYVRDVLHVVPLLIQVGLFATPIAYSLDSVSRKYRLLYSTLNPLGPVIETYRDVILRGQFPRWSVLLPAAMTSFAVLVFGYLVFKRIETGLADIA